LHTAQAAMPIAICFALPWARHLRREAQATKATQSMLMSQGLVYAAPRS